MFKYLSRFFARREVLKPQFTHKINIPNYELEKDLLAAQKQWLNKSHSTTAQQKYKKLLADYHNQHNQPPLISKFRWSGILLRCLILAMIIRYWKDIPNNDLFLLLHKESIQPQSSIDTTFQDVFAIDQHKDELQQIVDFLKNPHHYRKMGAELPRGLLLVGPPGTGKTLLARALAGEANCKLYYKSGAEFDEKFVGIGAKRVRNLFKKARSSSPSIIFIDEIDSIAGKRVETQPNHSKSTLNQLLTEMDGFNSSDNVVVIGATNFETVIDPAIKRPGRFDKVVHIPLPDRKGREQLLNFYLGKIRHGDICVKDLAGETEGFSGADIKNMVNISIIKAVKEGKEQAQKQNFQYALQRVRLGIKSNRKQSDKEKKATAIHQSGHALIALLTQQSPTVRKVTIHGAGAAKGYTSFHNDKERSDMTHHQIKALIDVSLGGRVAEELFLGESKVSSGCSDDLKKATDLAYNLLRIKGEGIMTVQDERMSCSDQFKFQIDEKAKEILEGSYSRVKELLKKHNHTLKKMADLLVEKDTIDGEDIKKLIV